MEKTLGIRYHFGGIRIAKSKGILEYDEKIVTNGSFYTPKPFADPSNAIWALCSTTRKKKVETGKST